MKITTLCHAHLRKCKAYIICQIHDFDWSKGETRIRHRQAIGPPPRWLIVRVHFQTNPMRRGFEREGTLSET